MIDSTSDPAPGVVALELELPVGGGVEDSIVIGRALELELPAGGGVEDCDVSLVVLVELELLPTGCGAEAVTTYPSRATPFRVSASVAVVD
jgi:hypothetical protein